MAISPEQKKAVKKRYEEIVAAGIPEGPDKQKLLADALKLDEKGFATAAQRAAAQQAYKEVVTDVDKKQEKLQEDILKSQEETAKLAATRSTYTGRRAEALEKSGLTPEVARARAQKEFETTYATPVTSPYGTLEERKPDKIVGLLSIPAAEPVGLQKEAGILTALSPQTSLPKSAEGTEAARLNKPAMLQVAGPGPDWEKIRISLMDGGLTSDEASKHLVAMKAAYDANLAKKSAQYAGKPFPKNFPLSVWEETVSELGGIPKALENKQSYIKDPTKAGPQDAYALAFSKQIKAGEGVPNLSLAQGKYIETLSNEEIKNNRKKLDAQYAGKPLIVDRTEVSEVRGGSRPQTKKVELKGAEREAELNRMAREGVEKPFWTDPAEVQRRLQDPKKYTQPGVFSDTSAFGTQQESTLGWLLRGAMAPLNVAAEFMYTGAMTGLDSETRSAVAEARRRARPAAYKDSPYLLNIAEGRGFTGNAQELAEITGLNKDVLVNLPVIGDITLGTVYVGGNLAADLLDPSLDILAGATKGVKTAKDISKAADLLEMDVKSVGKLAATEGVKDALKTFARENPATNLIASRMKVAPGDVRLILSEKIADDVIKGTPAPAGATKPKVIEEVEKKLSEFDAVGQEDVLDGTRKIMPKRELTDAFAEAAVRNPDVAKAIAEVEYASRKNQMLLNDARINLLESNAAVRSEVRNAIVRQTVRNNVFAATRNSVLESGLIALTRKTFATEDVANKIMKDVVSAPITKAINDIKSKPGNYTFGKTVLPTKGKFGSALQVVEGYRIDAETQKLLQKELTRLQNRGLLSQAFGNKLSVELINKNINNGFVSAPALRAIIDSNIDEAALKYKVATGKDIRELSPTVSQELTKPLEVRDFSNAGLKNWMLDKKLARPTNAMTPIQKTFVDEVVGAVSKLDVKLRNDVNRMLNNADFRAIYGAPTATVPTRKGALGYLIVGPKASGNLENTKRTLKLTMDKMFSSDKYVQDIFDMFQGIKVDNTTDIWSVAGHTELDKVLTDASKVINKNPEIFEDELRKLINEVKKLTGNPNLLKSDVGTVKSAEGDVINELLISSYYTAESNRIIKNSMDSLVKSEGGYLYEKYNEFSYDVKELLNAITPGSTPGPDVSSGPNKFAELVANYINLKINNPEFTKLGLEAQANKIGAFGVDYEVDDVGFAELMDKLADRGIDITSDALQVELMAEVADSARAILRNNQIPEMGTPVEDLMNLVKKAALPDSDVAAQMDAMLGKEIAGQIRSALSEAGQANIQAGLNKLLAEAADSFMLGKIRVPPMNTWLWKTVDILQSAFYTLILTAAPRFHGGNIFGAPSAVYSTTGKLISPLPIPGTSTYDSFQMLRKAATNEGGKIVVKDAAGRSYTADEIYKILVERGGETVNAAQIPAVQSRGALAAISEGAIEGAIDRALDAALKLPQYEDMMYRGAILIESLREGRSIEQAADLAKAALYDKGTITGAFEQHVARTIMFYSFTRNNLVNLLKNLSTVKGWQRIANTVKLKRGIENITVSEEERKYLPSTAATRIVLGKVGGADAQYIVAGPSDSTLSAAELLSTIIAGEIVSIVQGALSPAMSIFYGQKDDGREIRNVPAEHIALFSKLDLNGNGDPTTIASFLAGEEVVPYKSNEPGNIDGVVYPLLSEKARSRYKRAIYLLGYIGLSRLMSDIPNSFRAPGSKVAQAYQSGNVSDDMMTAAYAIGLMTPYKTLSAEKQRLKTLIAQNAEGKKMIGDIDDVLIEDKLAPIKGSDVSGQSVEVKAAKTEGRKQILALDDATQEFRRLASEINAIESRLRSGSLSEEEINILVAQIEKKVARMEELDRLNKITEREQKAGSIPSRPLPPRPF